MQIFYMKIDMDFLEAYRRYAYRKEKRKKDALEGIILDYCRYTSDFEELRKRLVWLLERNPVFKKDFGETQKIKFYEGLGVTVRPPESLFLNWWYRHVFSETEFGKIIINKQNPPVSAAENGKKSKVIEWTHHGLLIELMILKGFADKHGWGLDNRNFERDIQWFELHEEWQDMRPHYKQIEAESLIGLEDYDRGEYTNDTNDRLLRLLKGEDDLNEDVELNEDKRSPKVKNLRLRKKLPIKYIALRWDNNHPQIVDRMVLEYMRREKHELLLSADPHGKIERNSKSRKVRDYELLYALGVFLKAKTKRDYFIDIEMWPAYSMVDFIGIRAGQECYLRYDYNHNRDDNIGHWFEILDSCQSLEKVELRNAFCRFRKDYLAKSDSNFAEKVKKAVKRLKKQIETVILGT